MNANISGECNVAFGIHAATLSMKLRNAGNDFNGTVYMH
jgi:hypothetical protein